MNVCDTSSRIVWCCFLHKTMLTLGPGCCTVQYYNVFNHIIDLIGYCTKYEDCKSCICAVRYNMRSVSNSIAILACFVLYIQYSTVYMYEDIHDEMGDWLGFSLLWNWSDVVSDMWTVLLYCYYCTVLWTGTKCGMLAGTKLAIIHRVIHSRIHCYQLCYAETIIVLV